MSNPLGPIAAHRPHEVLVGKVEGEDRGPNPMDPPRRLQDPLFWLRDDARTNPDVLAHLAKEQAHFAERTQDSESDREAIYREHLSHINENDMSAPYDYGPFQYYTREVEGKSYKLFCRVPLGKRPEEAEEVLMDVNTMAEGKKFCDILLLRPSPCTHELVAYSVDWTGKEVYTIEFLANTKGVVDKVEGTSGDIIWGLDDTSFFYITKDDALRDDRIWRHVIGTPQSADVCVYHDGDTLFRVYVGKSGDGLTLLLGSWSSETSEVYLLDLRQGNQHTALELVRPREKGVRYEVGMHGTETLILLTNDHNAVNNKLLLASRATPADWSQVLLPHDPAVLLSDFAVYRSFIVLSGRRDGLSRVWTMTTTGADQTFANSTCREVPMNEAVFSAMPVYSETMNYDTPTFRMVYSSLATPNTWFDVDPRDHSRTAVKVRHVGGGFQAAQLRVERRFATASDGARIPLSVVYHASLDLTRPQPCMLYGYGSYGYCVNPEFSVRCLPYLERGMVFVVAHIRGGSDMGREWYEKDGKYLTKRNTFTDFIAAAEYLVQEKLTAPELLACEGRSAGGLLIGAVLNMRPDLFQVAIAGVPFVDVITTMCDPSIPLTTGEWEEWGNPNELKYFDYMMSYSPIDNVRQQPYPHLMAVAGLHDPRVQYWEPAKWVSKLRETKTNDTEVLFRIDMDSGHFSAKDRYKYWKEMAIEQAFVCKHLKATARLALK